MRKRTTLAITAFLFSAALWLGGLYIFTRDMQFATPDMPPAEKADAIVVLTGGSNRLKTGFDLLQQGMGKKLFISGVYQGVEVRELLAQTQNPAAKGIDKRVELGFNAADTLGNARETIEWLKTNRFKSVILVTANYHVKRALVAFGRYAEPMGADDIVITPHPVSPAGLDMANWWRDRAYRGLVLREYSKYVLSLPLYFVPERFL